MNTHGLRGLFAAAVCIITLAGTAAPGAEPIPGPANQSPPTDSAREFVRSLLLGRIASVFRPAGEAGEVIADPLVALVDGEGGPEVEQVSSSCTYNGAEEYNCDNEENPTSVTTGYTGESCPGFPPAPLKFRGYCKVVIDGVENGGDICMMVEVYTTADVSVETSDSCSGPWYAMSIDSTSHLGYFEYSYEEGALKYFRLVRCGAGSIDFTLNWCAPCDARPQHARPSGPGRPELPQ